MATSQLKYRPYFSSGDILEISRCLKLGSQNQELIRYLDTFTLKIQAGVQSPNLLVTTPNFQALLNKSTSPVDLGTLREQAYNKWLANAASCTSQEIARVHMYRYEHDLMDSEEEREYEKLQGLD